MSVKSANGLAWAGGVNTTDHIVTLISAPLTLTDEAEAAGFIAADTSYLYKMDLMGMTQIRLTGKVKTASASANTPLVRVRYHTAVSTTVSDFVSMGMSEVQFSIFTGAAFGDSGWIEMVQGCRINDCYVALQTIGGDADKDPVVNGIQLHFR
jgi:hypothetical protein